MVSLPDLWLPIMLSAVAVFFASFLAWVVLPHHKPDYKGVPEEDDFLAAVRDRIPPGQYMFPYCENPSALKDPETKKRYEAGPHGTMTVWPGPPQMGRNMAASVAFYLVASVFVGYLGSIALETEAGFVSVFRFTSTAAVMAYCLGFFPNAIWFGKKLRSVVMDVIDGVAYGLITGLLFAMLWPAAAG